MGLFSRFFGRPAPSSGSHAPKTSKAPRDVRTDPACLDLLAHFAWTRANALDLDPDWAQRLDESPRTAVQRLVRAGLLSPLSTPGRLDRLLTVAELKTHLKASGLAVGGNKAAMIERLMEHVPKRAEALVSDFEAYCPTPVGQALIDERATAIAIERDAAVDGTAAMIRGRDYTAAAKCKRGFEAGHKVQPRIGPHLRRGAAALSIQDRRDQAAVLRLTAEARPKYLGHLSESTWDDLRFAVAMDMLWGGGLVEWTATSATTLDGRDWLIVRSAIHARAKDLETRARAQAAGISMMTFGCCSDACEPCKAQTARAWPVADAPELPHASCVSQRGCLCISKPVMPSSKVAK